MEDIRGIEKLIKDQVAKDNWQVEQGIKTAKRSWNLEGNKEMKDDCKPSIAGPEPWNCMDTEEGDQIPGCLLIFDFLRVSQKARDV